MSSYPHLARLPPDKRDIALALAAIKIRHQHATAPAWRELARPEQVPPEGDWRIWYVRGGRGGGKTWTGGHTLGEWALAIPGEYAVVGPTYADARDTCVEGPSGLLRALAGHVNTWNRSLHDLRLRNGSVIWADGADDGAPTIMGKNLRGLWADEIGMWKRWQKAWEESIRYAVRLSPARIVATGTPKRGHGLVKLLMADDAIPKTVLRTADNIEHLDAGLVAELMAKYGGTTLGRQELGGEVLEDAEHALWHRNLIMNGDPPRIYVGNELVPDTLRIVIGVDPAVTHEAGSDETGIIVAALGRDGRSYVLADRSLRASPAGWAKAVVNAYHEFRADRIVPEVNNGGEMVTHTIHTVDPSVAVRPVHATQGKRTRAEPIVGLYEQRKVLHVDAMPELEDQMCNWDPEQDATSPDRMDALVWALTDLMLGSTSSNTEQSWIA